MIAGDGPALQLTRAGARRLIDDVSPLAAHFSQTHCLLLRSLIAPALLDRIHREIERGEFRPFDHDGIAAELRLQPGIATGLLDLIVNDAALFRFVETVTVTRPLRSFLGRVYRREARSGHFDSWHSDLVGGRRIGMSVNLSPEPYEGGDFELRDAHTDRTLTSIANVGLGDAILFRLSPTLEHQVTAVRGARAKTAFAGWFLENAGYHAGSRVSP